MFKKIPFFSSKRCIILIDTIIILAVIGLIYGSILRLSSHKTHSFADDLQSDTILITKNSELQGIDVSHYQGHVGWETIADAFSFAFLKATEGVDYTDPRFHKNAKNAQGIALLVGAYHFFLPEDNSLLQAQNFIKNVQQYPFTLPPVIDIEVVPMSDPTAFIKNIQIWLDYVQEHLGCQPIIYTNKLIWQKYIENNFNNYRVWISDYTTDQDKVESIPWSFWQFSDHGSVEGIATLVDKSRYKNTEEDLQLLGKCE